MTVKGLRDLLDRFHDEDEVYVMEIIHVSPNNQGFQRHEIMDVSNKHGVFVSLDIWPDKEDK